MNDQSNPVSPDELTGAIRADSGLTLPEIWQTLHANAREWQTVPRNARLYEIRDMLNDSDRQTLLMLSDVDAVQWEQICNGAGWTAIGAVALSWCNGAQDFKRVSARWQLSGMPVSSHPLCLRTAQMMHPGCQPPVSLLSELIANLEGNVGHIALSLAAFPDAFKIDLADEVLETAPPEIKELLRPKGPVRAKEMPGRVS